MILQKIYTLTYFAHLKFPRVRVVEGYEWYLQLKKNKANWNGNGIKFFFSIYNKIVVKISIFNLNDFIRYNTSFLSCLKMKGKKKFPDQLFNI